MARQGRRPRLRMLLASRPRLANRVLGLLGPRLVERAGRRAALRAARKGYAHAAYYRELYSQHGFDERRMRRLTWQDFQQLPTVGKSDILERPEEDLLDATVAIPDGDAFIARSSGTTREPIVWPTGWDEYYMNFALFKGVLRALKADRRKTLVVLALPVDGGPVSGNMLLRAIFAIKDQTRWPFEVVAAGELADPIIWFLRWFAKRDFDTLYLITFPGTMERVLDRIHELEAEDPGAGVDWSRYAHKRILLSGQVISRELRDRVCSEMGIAPRSLESMEVALASSDAGQIFARSSPFTLWLERYCAEHPGLAVRLGIPEEHQTKPLMEFLPPLGLYIEQDPDAGLLLTTWKHRPLIRYRSNDLAWIKPAREVVRTLDKEAKGWRRDFASYGFRRRDIPRVATLGMILGRADDIRFVNGAAVTPDILREALEVAGILPQIHHFKHNSDDAHPNEYQVYLELPDQRDTMAREMLAAQWRTGLLEALITRPAAADLQTAHRGTPIDLQLFVRSRGEAEFAGDDQRGKKRFTLTKSTAGPGDAEAVAVGIQPRPGASAAAED